MRLRRMAFLVLVGSQLGCQPAIGDACIQSTDCSIRGDRVCDTSQPSGYCTILQCLGNTCPLGSSCVAIDPSVPGCEYDDRHSPARSTRSLCLRQCNVDGDCRPGYSCQDIRQSPWRGRPLDDNVNTPNMILYKVCVVGSPNDASAPSTQAPVCSPNPPQNMTPIDGGSDATSDAASDAPSEAGSDAANEAGDAGTD